MAPISPAAVAVPNFILDMSASFLLYGIRRAAPETISGSRNGRSRNSDVRR
jgi:hypothetical protein